MAYSVVRVLVISQDVSTIRSARLCSGRGVRRAALPNSSLHKCPARGGVSTLLPFRKRTIKSKAHSVGVCPHCNFRIVLR